MTLRDIGWVSLVLGLAACAVSEPVAADGPVWKPTTVAWTDACDPAPCPLLKETALAHEDMQVTLRYNPAIDDPIAQWGDCTHAALSCAGTGTDLGICVATSECPPRCRDDYARRIQGVVDRDAVFAAFRTVFLDAGGLCYPFDDAEVTP